MYTHNVTVEKIITRQHKRGFTAVSFENYFHFIQIGRELRWKFSYIFNRFSVHLSGGRSLCVDPGRLGNGCFLNERHNAGS